MNTDQIYIVLDQRESLKESIFKDLSSTIFLTFLIYISHGSKWWTLFTGTIAILWILSMTSRMLKLRQHRFNSLESLKIWVNKQLITSYND